MIEELNGYVERAEKEALATNIKEMATINSQFHMALARLSKNVYLEVIMNMLQTQIGLIMSTSLSHTGRPLKNIEEHKTIISAIQSGDGDYAENTAKFHVRQSKENALKKIAEGGF
jgi:DNA-binding GntR family transcriptional regulator